ncbi:MAG TPA: AsmA family protein, partial [Methylomirabilota bacterium]|nr:AsmA family protein [Methylomirabilota bacterium]
MYFGIGVSIILALLVALVGPLFVDWTAYRSAFEEQATEILGHPVRVTGTADATLLPVPELTFTGVVIGADAADPLMTVGRFEVEVELFPLLTGEVRVTRMQLAQPELTLRVSEGGALDWIAEGNGVPVDPQKVVFDRVDVTDGSIRILDDRRPAPIEITGVNAAIEARSLIGPYKFDGGVVIEGEPAMLRVSTGARDDTGRLVVKATMTPASRPVELIVDGALTVAEGQPQWAGSTRLRRIVAEGDSAMPWILVADVEADPNRVRARQLDFRYGPEDRPFSISGAATIDLGGEPTFDAVLSARQIDLDRTLGSGPDAPVSFETALSAIAATLQAIPTPPIEGRVGFDIPGVVVGGSLVQSVRLDLVTASNGWLVETMNAALPGRTSLAATGALITTPATSFQGAVSLASEQPATLLAWWYPTRDRTLLDPFDVRARIECSAAGVRLSDLT